MPTPSLPDCPWVPEGFEPAAYTVWVPDPDMPGMAMLVTREDSIKALEAQGITYYGTVAGCVLYAGVQACAFDHPLRSEDVYSGAEALANGFSLKGLQPVGRRASYKIVAMPGDAAVRHPPQHPSEFAQRRP